jgi:hypothetical protein
MSMTDFAVSAEVLTTLALAKAKYCATWESMSPRSKEGKSDRPLRASGDKVTVSLPMP